MAPPPSSDTMEVVPSAERIFVRVRVEYGEGSLAYAGHALHFSPDGLFLTGRKLFPEGTSLTLKLVPRGGPEILLSGQVVRARQIFGRLAQVVQQGMAIDLPAPTPAYQSFFSSTIRSYIGRRKHPRLETRLEVQFFHQLQLHHEYTENVSYEGLFIATRCAFEGGTLLDITVIIPELTARLSLQGRVAYVVDKEHTQRWNVTSGIGIQIVDFDESEQKLYRSYVDRLLSFYDQ